MKKQHLPTKPGSIILYIIKILTRILPDCPIHTRTKIKEAIINLEEVIRLYNTPDIPEQRENKLFRQFRQLVINEELFKDPHLTRDQLVRRLYTNKNYLIKAIQHNTSMSFTGYINSLRLDESIKIMNKYPELPMEVVAERAGFGSSRSFYRHFHKRFGMHPAEYRNKDIKKPPTRV